MIALAVSWTLEGHAWSLAALGGLILVVTGNMMVMGKRFL